jgi:hypothetical protein
MKSLKSVLAGAAVLAIAGAGMAMNATSAFADTPNASITGDPNASLGTVSFYNASGTQITSGTLSSLQYTYAVASTDKDRAATTNQKATVFYALPDHTQADSQNWFSSQATTATNFPVTTAGAPASITGLGANRPVNTMKSGDSTLAGFLSSGVMDTTAGWANFVQVRLADTGTGQATRTAPFWQAVLQVDTTAGTWTQVYPQVATATTTTLASSANPSINGASVTLTATVSPIAAGTVVFKDNGTSIGTGTVDAAGHATATTTFTTNGSHPLTADFTPTDPASFSPSSGSLTQTVNPPATATTTNLAVSGGPTTADPYTLTATVAAGTTPVGAGTVAFYDNGSSTAIAGTVASGPTGTYTLTTSFTSGAHSIVAKFTPTDVTVYQASQSTPQTFTTQAPAGSPCADPASVCSEVQNIQASIPVGTLVINTPYTSASPLDLGALVLATDGSMYSGSQPFQHIKVTDTRAGNQAWTAAAQSSQLTSGTGHTNGFINASNVGLTGLSLTTSGSGFDSSAGNLTLTPNPVPATPLLPGVASTAGLGGAQHTFAHATHGLGSVDVSGTLTLIAPTSTEPGLFTGSITFTVG